jgi:CRP-like cAMP-binding protein
VAAGRNVSDAHAAAAAFLVVESGVIAVRTPRSRLRRCMTVAIAAEGDLVAPPGAHEQLVALVRASLTAISPHLSRSLFAFPDVAALVLERLVEALHERQTSLAQFGTVDHAERVRTKLVQLARTHGKVTKEGVHLDLPITHELLAQTTGSARETVSHALASLSREGFVVREGRRYTITVSPELLVQ